MKKMWKRISAAVLALILVLGLAACGGGQETDEEESVVVKVGVVGEFNAQWEVINELLADDGIQVELVKYTDYAVPNRALHDGEIDMNAFQHKAFLAKDIKEKGYEILSAEATKVPQNYVTLADEDTVHQMELLLEHLDDCDDVQEVYHNWENADEE